MKKIFQSFIITLTLTGCATASSDPTLAPGVDRKGVGLYSVSEMSVLFGDPVDRAVQQCQMDGNKKLSVEATTTKTGIVSDRTYAVILFRCK